MPITLAVDAPLRIEVTRFFRLDALVATASPTGSATTYQPTQALGPSELQRRIASSVGSMLDGEPGIATRSLGAAPTRPVIRGFDGDRVLVLENGERMGDLAESAADHALAMDPFAVRRVEVVRGPASLLYGSSALGGVVNLVLRIENATDRLYGDHLSRIEERGFPMPARNPSLMYRWDF